ncbi:MAG: hypothetical protein ACRDD8_16040 [Bacteroidales bacterium]
MDTIIKGIEYQNKMLEALTQDEMIEDQKLIREIHKIVNISPTEAFMINVNANLWAALFQKYYWGDDN